jgi:tRNA/tmRNA/rRNA uracil-C5-methylase (TrmA/RlmC/RlmD family)
VRPFEEILSSVIRSEHPTPRPLAEGECRSFTGAQCTLCHAGALDYPTEVKYKNAALQRFWQTLAVPVPLDPLVPAPLGRNYRTTTKRRAFMRRGSVHLGLISPAEDGRLEPFPVVRCAIEPSTHCAIYNHLQEKLVKPHARSLAGALSYVVIKGNYNEQAVIFNVREMSAGVVHAANTVSRNLTRHFPSVIGLFLYHDSTNARYYMGARRRQPRTSLKKLFGKGEVFHRVLGRSFLFSPLSFSQVNLAMLDTFIRAAGDLLRPSREETLFDLYCGYGLFGLCLTDQVKKVVGVEASPASVAAAGANARRQKAANARFVLSDITGETIGRIMRDARAGDLVILDPPRSGTAAGVIECIAARRPSRVLHIFCEIDLIQKELARWQASGYHPVQAVPCDMFPGTASIETLVLLEPSKRS